MELWIIIIAITLIVIAFNVHRKTIKINLNYRADITDHNIMAPMPNEKVCIVYKSHKSRFVFTNYRAIFMNNKKRTVFVPYDKITAVTLKDFQILLDIPGYKKVSLFVGNKDDAKNIANIISESICIR